MLDLFTIFSKGGIVLWCFQGTSQLFTPSVNALIKSVILQERGGTNTFTHESLKMQFKLDNEFELVFVVAFQKILQLSYIDKLLDDIQREFKDKYKNELQLGELSRNFNFTDDFQLILRNNEESSLQKAKAPKKMRTFEDSQKSKKTMSSMVQNKYTEEKKVSKTTENKNKANKENIDKSKIENKTNGELDEDIIKKNREKFFLKQMGGGKKKTAASPKSTFSPKSEESTKKKAGKQSRKWENAGTNKESGVLDFSSPHDDTAVNGDRDLPDAASKSLVGTMGGNLRDMEPESSDEEFEEQAAPTNNKNKSENKKSGGFGVFSMFKGLVGSKSLTREDIEPALAKMKDHLVSKNVAADIAERLCESVAAKLEGKVLGTFSGIASTVKETLNEACIQLLSPKRRINILRDAMDAKQQGRPYVVSFCGVNGVGKSTNLAKVCFWLVENGFRVLIAACDTFRAGAVEQLRTHTRKLNALHPADEHGGQQMVQLYEKGYGKDAAGIAMEAINYARDFKVDVVLIDTAGRMQDNEPLMRALAKLIKVNQPDLVLFVGEALVGNEAVDQLKKFNQALADHSNMENPRLIDGIVLTKFDTIDDKVGAAISMTYTTGQPIIFVGTGQTYTDIMNLNAKAVVHALLKP